MTDSMQALPDVALASQLPQLRDLAAQLRRQAAQADQLIAQAARALSTVSVPAASPDLAVVGLTPADIQLPGRPPDASAHLFANWPREGLVLAVLAVTGWSLRLAVAEAVASRFNFGAQGSSQRRIFDRLDASGLCRSEKQHFRIVGDVKTCILIRLTARGAAVMRAVGIEPMHSEWERLESRLPVELVAGAVTLAYHVRRLGYIAEVGHDAVQPVRLTCGVEPLWVAAVHVGLLPEERSALWRDQVARQGQIAFWAPTPQERETLAQEALVFSPIVRSTDPWVLTAAGSGLWAVT
jgi:hypothetical protein